LMSKTMPDFKYLNVKLGITNIAQLKQTLIENAESVNLKELAADVSPFLIKNDQIDRVLMFKEFVESL
ncbi:MAG TPA: nucleotidyl transferase AbiEii/AbiGii toxin family protein, partial [bacterium]|nr:nucleotidyl transferase AbiEii/AbiGii toxin family protein [bacterium]